MQEDWVLVKFYISCHNQETLFFTIDPCYGNLNKISLTRTQKRETVEDGSSDLHTHRLPCSSFTWVVL